MVARPGLYDELKKRNLLDRGRIIALGDGSDTEKADRLDDVLSKAGSIFNVTPRAVFILRHKLETEPPAEPPKSGARPCAPPKPQNGGSVKKRHEHDGRRQNRPPPGPHSTGFQPGNDASTTTGAYRNPLLHHVSPEQAAMVMIGKDLSPADVLRRSIEVYQLSIIDMSREIEAIKASTKRWWWLGSTYKRQEGDGELMGTGRISERRRLPKEEALRVMLEARAKIQGRLDGALLKWHEMTKKATPLDQDDPLAALVDTLAESRRLAGAPAGGEPE